MVSKDETMEKNKQIFTLLIISLGLFFFVILMLILSFIFVLHGDQATGITLLFVKYHIHFMVLLGILGIGVGVVSYLGFTSQQKNIQASNKFSKEIIYKFLDITEKKIIQHLLENGVVTQSTISKLDDIGKVKSFRTLQRLEQKGLITLEAYGKTNRVHLNESVEKALK